MDHPTSTTETVGRLDDHPIGSMRLARVAGRRVAVVRTSDGVHAIDNACPHQGYGLVTGSLDGDVVTCQWHNWKYRVSDGRCLVGEEDVACHRVDVVDGEVQVTVESSSPDQRRARLWPSLLSALDRDYVGQLARDTARLLDAGATPADIVGRAIVHAAPRIENGLGHETANAADCLHLVDLWDGLDRTLPLVQALAGIAETARDRPAQPVPEPDPTIDLAAAIEAQDADAALASVAGQLTAGVALDELRRQLVEAASTHHLSYGHGAIYTQKTFELLEAIGEDRATDLLPWLALSLVDATREDALPYLRTAARAIDGVDLAALAAAPDRVETGWRDDGSLRSTLLAGPEAAIAAAAAAVADGAGIEGLLDTVSLAVSERLLRHDPAVDFDHGADFGWLDITHGLTYANAARWAWRHHPGPATARLALWTVWLAHDTGRAERRAGGATVEVPAPAPGDVGAAVLDRRPDDAVAHALAGTVDEVGAALGRTAMADRAGSFIVAAHVVKLAEAARRESAVTSSMLPLAAAARFAAAPRLERFVAASAIEAVRFVRTGAPPRR